MAAWVCAVALTAAAAAACAGEPSIPPPASTTPAAPATAATPPLPVEPVTLSGWKLTLPVAGRKGDAAAVDPAAATPPWLVADSAGGVTLWAPVAGSTTPHSSHTRTELDSHTSFLAGVGRHVLTATVAVTQLPREKPDVIVGQIHGADVLSSIPFVMLHDQSGAIVVVVKQNRAGPEGAQYPLLANVPLGVPFRFTISDNGDGGLTFTATTDGQTATANAPIPTAFNKAPVRFQAGDYQQADTNSGGASPGDGARVTFHELTTNS
jgi:Alginate lyase